LELELRAYNFQEWNDTRRERGNVCIEIREDDKGCISVGYGDFSDGCPDTIKKCGLTILPLRVHDNFKKVVIFVDEDVLMKRTLIGGKKPNFVSR